MKYVIVLGFVAVLVGVFAYTSLFSVKGEMESIDEVETVEVSREAGAVDEPQTGSESLEALRLRQSDLECSITYETMAGEVTGTLFTSEGMLRGDFMVPSPDLSGEMLSSMILTDSELLIWTEWEGTKQGMSMPTAELEAGADANEPVAIDDAVEYRCESWSPVDRSVFERPGDVLFYDYSDMMQGGPEFGTIYEVE